jgi:cell division septum initiation protein DivIVA
LEHSNSPAQFPDLGVDIQHELNQLEEMILDSPRVPLTGKTMINEEELLEQLDFIRLNLPEAFQNAQELLQRRDLLLKQAEEYGQKLVDVAEDRAADLTDELGIIRQAELEAQQVRAQVQQECQQLRDNVLAEVEQIRRQAKEELDEMRQEALEESQEIQRGADEYADRILGDMERQLNDMMRVIRNGRQQLGAEPR